MIIYYIFYIDGLWKLKNSISSNFTGRDFLDAVDPTGYFYDVTDGQIVPGGSISVTSPPGGAVTLVMDGSSGQYIFTTNGVEGDYTITVTPPLGYIIDPRRPPANYPGLLPYDPSPAPPATRIRPLPRRVAVCFWRASAMAAPGVQRLEEGW